MSSERVFSDMDMIMNRIREKITERGAVGIRGLGRLFRIADDNGDQKIDLKNELPKLLGDIGVLLNRTEINELARMLDRDGDGSVSFDEFIYYFAPPMNDVRKEWVNRAFDKMDRNGNGVLDVEDLKMAHPPQTQPIRPGQKLKSSAETIFQNLCKSYDKDGDSTITREEFMDYYREQSPSIDTDEMFIQLICTGWGLTRD